MTEDKIVTMEEVLPEPPEELPVGVTEDEIKEAARIVQSGVYPTGSIANVLKLVHFVNHISTGLTRAAEGDNKFVAEDIKHFEKAWFMLFEIKDSLEAIEKELKGLGFINKVVLAINGIGAALKLIASIRKFKKS